MSHIDIIVDSTFRKTFRTSQIAGIFDVPLGVRLKHEWHIDLPINDKQWNIGLIYGSSGSGKTTIAKKIWPEYYIRGFDWDEDMPVIDNFPKDIEINKIIEVLTAVGFSSPPSWIKPFKVLSTGEKFRSELARCLIDDRILVVFDEFTSVVDRIVAKIGSVAISKNIKKQNKKFIALSCHSDIIEWLEPDWIYRTDTNEFQWVYLRRPAIELQLFRVYYKAWEMFKQYHYLTSKLNKAARCFICEWNGVPVGFTSALPLVGRVKGIWRGHRTVVLPDYQGIGIGNAMLKMLAQYFKKEGYRFRGTTSHPALVYYRLKHPEEWKLVKIPSSDHKSSKLRPQTAQGRLVATFEYIGE